MMSEEHHYPRNYNSGRRRLVIVGVLVTVLLTASVFVLGVSSSHPETSKSTTSSSAKPAEGVIVLETTSNGIVHYRCQGPGILQIVLLHGAGFSKETWKDNNILQDFCRQSQVVVALDWPPAFGHERLKSTLEALTQANVLNIPEHVVLVTPSASGYSMVDWMIKGDVTRLPSYVDTWVPVATGSLTMATDEQVQSLQGNVNIFAINGDEDKAGGKYSERLAELAGATAVELPGRHAVYLQSPKAFVTVIVGIGQKDR